MAVGRRETILFSGAATDNADGPQSPQSLIELAESQNNVQRKSQWRRKGD